MRQTLLLAALCALCGGTEVEIEPSGQVAPSGVSDDAIAGIARTAAAVRGMVDPSAGVAEAVRHVAPARTMPELLQLDSEFSLSLARQHPHWFAYTAVVSAYRRVPQLRRMALALCRQTHPPREIWFSVFASPVGDAMREAFRALEASFARECEQAARETLSGADLAHWRAPALFLVDGGPQLRYHARFQLALQTRWPFVALFDDDCEPQPRFVEGLLRVRHIRGGQYAGILGVKGHAVECFAGSGEGGRLTYHGPLDRTDRIAEVDVVGGAWFLPADWLRLMWRTASLSFMTGEDYHLCTMARRYVGATCFAMPFVESGPLTRFNGVAPDYLDVSSAGDTTGTHVLGVQERTSLSYQLFLRGMPTIALRPSPHQPPRPGDLRVLYLADGPAEALFLSVAVASEAARMNADAAAARGGAGDLRPLTSGVMVVSGRGMPRFPSGFQRAAHAAVVPWRLAALPMCAQRAADCVRSLAAFDEDHPTLASLEFAAASATAQMLRGTGAPALVLSAPASGDAEAIEHSCRSGSLSIKLGAAAAAGEAGVGVWILEEPSPGADQRLQDVARDALSQFLPLARGVDICPQAQTSAACQRLQEAQNPFNLFALASDQSAPLVHGGDLRPASFDDALSRSAAPYAHAEPISEESVDLSGLHSGLDLDMIAASHEHSVRQHLLAQHKAALAGAQVPLRHCHKLYHTLVTQTADTRTASAVQLIHVFRAWLGSA